MGFGRILLAWAAVAAWLIVWAWIERRGSRDRALPLRDLGDLAGEAALVTLFGALWFASLGAGAWGLPFLLVGGLREWPLRSLRGFVRVARILGAGAILAWTLPA